MTPPINSVSPERLAELRKQHPLSDEALRGIAANEFGIDDPGLCAELAAELLAARRATNTPVGDDVATAGKHSDICGCGYCT